MADPLRLYWWRDTPNFGDAINPHIVAHVSGREVEWSPPETADLFATGSVMHFVRAAISSGRETTPVVWGSGCLNAMRRDFVPKVGFAAVRGPLTREWLGLPPGSNGDPALLLPDVLGKPVARTEPHSPRPALQAVRSVAACGRRAGRNRSTFWMCATIRWMLCARLPGRDWSCRPACTG